MKIGGYVEDFRGHRGRVWARTPQGTALLARKDQVLGL
jgi:hypothetical protein